MFYIFIFIFYPVTLINALHILEYIYDFYGHMLGTVIVNDSFTSSFHKFGLVIFFAIVTG